MHSCVKSHADTIESVNYIPIIGQDYYFSPLCTSGKRTNKPDDRKNQQDEIWNPKKGKPASFEKFFFHPDIKNIMKWKIILKQSSY